MGYKGKVIKNKLGIKVSHKGGLSVKSVERQCLRPSDRDLHYTCGSLTGSWPSWGSHGPSRTGSGIV